MHRHAEGHVYDMCMGMCIDICIGTFIGMCIDMQRDMCIDMCIHMCIHMHIFGAGVPTLVPWVVCAQSVTNLEQSTLVVSTHAFGAEHVLQQAALI